MVNTELVDYIKKKISSGGSLSEAKEELLKEGFSGKDVEDATIEYFKEQQTEKEINMNELILKEKKKFPKAITTIIIVVLCLVVVSSTLIIRYKNTQEKLKLAKEAISYEDDAFNQFEEGLNEYSLAYGEYYNYTVGGLVGENSYIISKFSNVTETCSDVKEKFDQVLARFNEETEWSFIKSNQQSKEMLSLHINISTEAKEACILASGSSEEFITAINLYNENKLNESYISVQEGERLRLLSLDHLEKLNEYNKKLTEMSS